MMEAEKMLLNFDERKPRQPTLPVSQWSLLLIERRRVEVSFAFCRQDEANSAVTF